MGHVLLFHSVLGVRQGVHEAAAHLRSGGHSVNVADLFAGQVFDDYDVAGAFAESIGYEELIARALALAAAQPEGTVYAGFSAGAGLAQICADSRHDARGAVLMHGVLSLGDFGAQEWRSSLPVQIHLANRDPFLASDGADSLLKSVREADGSLELYGYPGGGHLFSDPTLPNEYDAVAAGLMLDRVSAFVSRVSG